jgi:2-methylaconitate cis-trans-isomerase PrpF
MGALIERLSREFETRVDPETVTAIVLECRDDLDAAGQPASPEAVEQLARRRLHHAIGVYATTAVADTGAAAGSSAALIIQFLTE